MMNRKYRRRTPAQHAAFLKYISNVQFAIGNDSDIHANFDKFYEEMHILLDQFYPDREISVTSADPCFVTPIIKSMLRRKNQLMRSGRLDEADALTKCVCMALTRQNSLMLRKCDTRKSNKQTWAKVRHILGRNSTRVYEHVRIDVHKLNNHYAVISTDSNYTEPRVKLTAHDSRDLVKEIETFNMLDHLKTSAAGLDAIPTTGCASIFGAAHCIA